MSPIALATAPKLVWLAAALDVSVSFFVSQCGAPVFSSNGLPIGTEPILALTVNAGGGLKMPMNEKLALRTDARWFKSFGRQGSEQFRVGQGISFDLGKR